MISVALLLLVPLGGVGSAVGQPSHLGTSQVAPLWVWSSSIAGWHVLSANHSVTDVKGSWIVAPLASNCVTAFNGSGEITQSVKVDGVTSHLGEEVGTYSLCNAGAIPHRVYGAYYTFIGKGGSGSGGLLNLTVHPRDFISAEIKFSAGKFTLSIRDLNSSKSVAKSFTKAQSSASPRNATSWNLGYAFAGLPSFPLAKFGWNYTGIKSTNSANISGVTHSIGGFSSREQVRMYDTTGTILRALPSALNDHGTSFTVAWKHF